MENRGQRLDVAEAVPPWDARLVLRVTAVGAVLAAASAGLALAAEATESVRGPGFDAARLIAATAGVLTAAVGVWLRPGLAAAWLVAAAASALAAFGSPPEWHSARLLAGVFAAVCLVAAGLARLPLVYRFAVVSALVVLHFAGILTAVTSPPPQPWISGQLWVMLYRPYLQFLYLNNAYQFYSPNPGPAVLIWACAKYKTDDPAQRYRWLQIPTRPRDMKDPLAITYYRRLSLTEQLNQAQLVIAVPTLEDLEAQRRRMLTDIPFAPNVLQAQQYRPVNNDARKLILPSYARRLALEMAREGGPELESVKIYRVEHRILTPREIAEGVSPYDPTTYQPYFQGEYDPEGRLVNPKDPMLY
ncbi:MAG TPA: hypothetical protein VIL46_01915, partial [Gemmataceae bacterium]